MSNIEVKINRRTREVNPKQIFIGMDGENLQENVIFSFEDEFVDGQARIEFEYADGTKYRITDIQKSEETYVLKVKSALTKFNGCMAQLVVVEPGINEEYPIFKSFPIKFVVSESISAIDEQPDEYVDWFVSANAKLNEMDETIQEADEKIEVMNEVTTYARNAGDYANAQGQRAEEFMDDFSDTIQELDDSKVDKVEGKGLSTEDYTTAEKTKLANLENYDDTEVKASISSLQTTKADKSEIPDVSSFITKDVNNLTNYTLKTSTGSLIDLEINSTTYVITLRLKDVDGNVISTDTIDLPLESVVVSGSFDKVNKKIVLRLQNGNTVDIPVGDLIAGLQTEITSTNKLASDLIDDSNSGNKFTNTSEKQTWNNKYDKPIAGIPKSDLASSVQTSLGKADTALQEHQDLSSYALKSELPTKTSDLTNDSNFTTKAYVDGLVGDINTALDTINGEVI